MEGSFFCVFNGARVFLSLHILMVCFMHEGCPYGVEGKITSHSLTVSSLLQGCPYGVEGKITSHSLPVSSLLPSPSCSPSTSKASSRKSTLEVVHNYGPCSPLFEDLNPLNHTKVLLQDVSRVKWIQSQSSNGSDGLKASPTASLPAKSGITMGTGNYVVTIGLGTPKKDLTLEFDTGSRLTWTQCEPCAGSCYTQSEPIFNPSQSSSYANVSCNTTSCSQLGRSGCSGSTCLYAIQYGDQSYTIGFFATEKLTLTPTEAIDNFEFGCGQNNQGLFGRTAGLMGLSNDNISIVEQTAAKYGKYFSYCLPSSPSSTGHLTFGKDGGAVSSVSFTPLSTVPQSSQFYGISIQGIAVGGNRLSILSTVFSSGGAIIDSGTVISRLPPTAYSALRTAFRSAMANYTMAPALRILDTCYDFSKESTITVPLITFSFAGGVDADLDPNGIFFIVNASQVCLAFAPNRADSNLGIYGNTQQKTFEVVYDVAGGKLGFGSNGCS
ncbi:aspartyl protease family protein At5g10770 isoform X2 [Eucalyptus grandis]|uniref:aspartyl protease family protein At5g10770 isoform X2 n=1 Tax=Eucalyptus grandis TaxID=71139 RepID=UPI00192EED26|nr:aspartyl protease family protein At5g10770 isoform X2 [Eucalyptus grandis]